MPNLVREWFTSRYTQLPKPKRGVQQGATASGVPTTGTFVSEESLKTFGGATIAVTVIWAGVEKGLSLAHSDLIGLVVSLAVGGALLVLDLTDRQRSPEPRTAVRVLAAVINAFIIYGAASSALSSAASPASALAAGSAKPASVSRPN